MALTVKTRLKRLRTDLRQVLDDTDTLKAQLGRVESQLAPEPDARSFAGLAVSFHRALTNKPRTLAQMVAEVYDQLKPVDPLSFVRDASKEGQPKTVAQLTASTDQHLRKLSEGFGEFTTGVARSHEIARLTELVRERAITKTMLRDELQGLATNMQGINANAAKTRLMVADGKQMMTEQHDAQRSQLNDLAGIVVQIEQRQLADHALLVKLANAVAPEDCPAGSTVYVVREAPHAAWGSTLESYTTREAAERARDARIRDALTPAGWSTYVVKTVVRE